MAHFTLDEIDFQRVKRAITAFEQGRYNVDFPDNRPTRYPVKIYTCQANTTITTRSGTTLGTGSVSVFSIQSGLLTSVATGGFDVNVYNISSTNSVPSGSYLMTWREAISGQWVVDTCRS